MTEKTLLIVAPYFPPHTGGLERYAYEVARRMKTSWRVVVVTSGCRGGHDEVEEHDGLTIYRLGYSLRISNSPLGLLWPLKLRRLHRNIRPDIMHIHAPVPGMGDIAARACPVPYVLTYHTGSMRKGRPLIDLLIGMYERVLLPRLLRRALRVCASSEAAAAFLARMRTDVLVVPPAVDTSTFVPSGRARSARILFVAADLSRACRYKGLSTLLAAVALARNDVPDMTLAVVGDGDMRSMYEAQARELGIASAVRFLGRLSGEALVCAYREADVFALPTENDSYPTVILEALASGLPVVSTPVGDIPKIVEDGVTGCIVPVADPQRLARSLARVCGTEGEAMARTARTHAVTRYDWDARAAVYRALYADVCAAYALPPVAVIAAYYPPHLGGVERFAQESARRLAAHRQVFVITSQIGALRAGTEQQENLTTLRLHAVELLHTPIAPALALRIFALPRRTIVHLHTAQAYWPELTWLACRLRGLVYIAHFHLDVAPSGRLGALIFPLYKRVFWRLVLRGACRVVVCSPAQVALVAARYGVDESRITVVENAVDDMFFVPVSRTRHTTPRLLFVGRLVVQKRVDRLLDAMALLGDEAELEIVGGGDLHVELMARAQKLGLSNVQFLGSLSGDALVAQYRVADAFVISSEHEGAPLSVIEALASGLPVIGTNVPGIHELLVDGAGILVAEPYPEGIAAAVRSLADESFRTQLARRAAARVTRATWERVTDDLSNIYARIRTLPL